MSIMEYNGAAIVAMKGLGCVAIAADRRLGIQAETVATDFQKVFKIHDRCFIGLSGLATDVQTLNATLQSKHSLYELRENRKMKPKAFTAMVCHTLYSKRFGPYFVEPVIAGLEPKPDGTFEPFISSADLIGCPMYPDDFVVAGTMADALLGPCESLWRPNMEPEDLFECISQCLLSGMDRDAVSGWGAIVHVITKDEIITRTLKTRMD
eukprot:c39464_g1_i1.p1 GENE.c39464_g1_i1~~c39464_g1_i1.p1  ORF type:complete len:209 (+),score=44.14 c39464_g1_i1:45-671(+)